MKIIKNLVLYVLAGIFLGPFACLRISNTAECSSGGDLDVEVDFGLQRWSDDWAYCTFPELTVTESLPNSIKTIQISCSGEDTTNFQIIPPTMDGFTASEDNTSTLVTCTKTESGASVQEFLRNVHYRCETSQSITILLSESEIPSDTHYFPGTGHFYKYVPKTGLSWTDAYKEAMNSEFGGWQGYLAVITSKEEDDFYKKYAATDGVIPYGWLGGTQFKISNMGTTDIAASSESMGYFYWACGPESCFAPADKTWTSPGLISKNNMPEGTYGAPKPTNSAFYNKIKYNGSASNVHVVYNYAPWKSGEPNNDGGASEGYLGTYTSDGKFNDFGLGVLDLSGYTIEYGDRLWGNSTTLAGSIIVSTNITKQTTIIAPTQNDELGNYQPTISGTGAPGYTVNIVEDGKILGTTQVDPDGYWSVQLSNPSLGMHTVSVTQADPSGNTFPSVSLSFKILKTPTLDLFDIALTEDLTYNCALKQFVVTLMPGVTGMGPFAVKYFKVNSDGTEAELDGPPTDVGRYRAKLYIEKGSDYTAAVFRIVYFPKT